MSKKLTVIIPTYNNNSGLNYLLNYLKDKLFNVIVVDNKPTKEKQLGVRSYGLGGRLLYLPQKINLGFAKAVNLGAKYVKTGWMLILNDDIEFGKKYQKSNIKNQRYISNIKNLKDNTNTIERLINYAEKNKLDAVSAVLRNPDGRVENYGYRVLSYGKIELIKEMPKQVRHDKNTISHPEFISGSQIELDGITAACLLIKTSVFKKLKGFDESFFAYLEDVDFFLRLKKISFSGRAPLRLRSGSLARMTKTRNFGIAYDIEVIHNHMITTKTMGNFKAKQDMINWWRLYLKHPDIFSFNLKFIMERLRNVSGYLKKTLKMIK